MYTHALGHQMMTQMMGIQVELREGDGYDTSEDKVLMPLARYGSFRVVLTTHNGRLDC
jgi:hypothetical protein